MSKKSLQTPQDRRSMLGFGSAKVKAQQKKPPEQKRLTFSANRSRLQASGIGKRWSSQGAHIVKDTRPLSNRAYQKQMVEDILEFLNDSGYQHQISAKILSAPTTKEFLRVFEHLYSYINSNYKMGQKHEEEVPRILKSLNYPFTISKSAMFAIGSLHTWPTLLGALHWMVELIRTVTSIDVEEMLFPMSFEDGNTSQQEKMFFEYFAKTYQEFMLGMDDFSKAQEILQSALIKNAGCSEEDHQNLIDEVESLEQELAALEAEPDPLEEALKIKASLDEHIEQDGMAIKELDQQYDVLKQQRIQLKAQIEEEGVTSVQLGDPARQEEIKHRSSEIKARLERLTMEKERLEQQNCEREVRFSKLYQKFYSTVSQYNDIARELSLNPVIKRYIGEESIALFFDHNQKDLSALDDCKNRLKPLLVKLANQVAEDRYQLEEQNITEEEKLDQLTEMCAEKQTELTQLKTQLANLDKELESRTEFLDKEYQSATSNLREQEEFLAHKLKEIKETAENEAAELNATKATFYEKQAAQSKVKKEVANGLISYCMAIKKHQDFIEDRVKSLNNILEQEVQKEVEMKERIRKLVEDGEK